MDHYFNTELSDINVSEKEKQQPEYLMAAIDDIIAELVTQNSLRRKMMGKMRDLYAGIRDPEEYQYLTDNYGIGNPLDLKFTPVVRNRIEALIGLLSATTFDWKVSVIDDESIRTADIMKSAKILNGIFSQFEQQAEIANLYDDPILKKDINTIIKEAKEETEKNWINIFEKSANNLVKYYKEDSDILLKELMKIFLEDIAVVGECAFRVLPKEYGKLPVPKVLLPENFYYDLPPGKKFIKESRRAVYLEYMTKKDVLQEWGHLMTQEQLDELFSMETVEAQYLIATGVDLDRIDPRMGLRRGSKRKNYQYNIHYLPVYHVEWIANNKYKIDPKETKDRMNVSGPNKVNQYRYRQDRYEGIRIGTSIYLNMGKSEFVKRSKKDPDKTYLSFDGVRFSDRNGDPYSMVWKTKDIQDMIDINIYHRDNLIANSGVNGSRLNVAALPKFLGKDLMERLLKVIALRKQGVDPVDPTQEGADQFQHYGDFNNAIPGQTLQAINEVLRELDDEVSKITGVTPQMMGLIEQREAVSNVKMGVNQSSLVLKNFYDHNDLVIKSLLTSLIEMTQMSMRDSEMIYTLLGDKGSQSFKIIPKYFSFSDYNIHVTSISDEYSKLMNIKNSIQGFAASGAIDPKIAFKTLKADSVSEIIELVENELDDKKKSQETIKQLEQQLDQLNKENKKLNSKLEQINEAELQIKQNELKIKDKQVEYDKQIKDKSNQIKEYLGNKEISYKQEAVKLERDQLYLQNATEQSREINNKTFE